MDPSEQKKNLLIQFHVLCPLFQSYNARAHMAWGTRVALRRPSQNRLKIGVRREGTLLSDLLES